MTIGTEMSLNADGNTAVTACLLQQLGDCSMRVMLLRETNGLIIIIIIMLTFIVRLLLQNKNIGAVQKYKWW